MDVATMQMNRFAIDDHACYGPHKTIFVGTIVKITEEIVTLKVWSRVVRMCIADFCKRNIAFDHEKALEINTWARSSRREFDI